MLGNKTEYNRVIDTDSYKASHYLQYPSGTTRVFSYLESRGCEEGRDYNSTVFFGLQYLLKRYLSEPFRMEDVDEARDIITAHGEPFNYDGWRDFIWKRGGRPAIRVRAVPEGTAVPLHNILMSVENTDPEFFWMTSYLETIFVRLWYPITVATQSFFLRKLIKSYLDETADNPDAEIAFKLHDFGSRGVSSQESAAIGGASHLLSFQGTDTMVALQMLKRFYNEPMAGFSIPAAEHSTISSWGREGEVEAYRNMLRQYAKPNSLVAVVSDTWDIYNAVEHIWGEQLRQEVIDSGATIVIRPDSGDPLLVVLKVAQLLAEKFGTVTNSKGYRVLNNVRIIQGDGVNPNSIAQILEGLKIKGFSTSNIAFGMGGALLQKVNRDTLKFAFKCSAIERNGQVVEVYKDPVTDNGKRSKRGILDLHLNEHNEFQTVLVKNFGDHARNSALRTVYEDGKILIEDDFSTIRERLVLTGKL
jgi:nicotinamide phosphoribosyltransferase